MLHIQQAEALSFDHGITCRNRACFVGDELSNARLKRAFGEVGECGDATFWTNKPY